MNAEFFGQLATQGKPQGLGRYIAAMRPILERVRRDVSAIKKPNGNFAWTSEPLTDELIRQHLSGGTARGVAPIKAGEKKTRLALLDFDSHKGETDWAGMVEVASAVIDELEAHGYPSIPFRSGGGKGIHLYMLWDEPQDARSVRQTLAGVLAGLGFSNGTGGVVKKQIEIFPKQDAVPVGGYGNQFILPLAGKSEPLDYLFGLMPMGRDFILKIDWPTCPPVPVVAALPPTERSIASGAPEDIETIRSALEAIPNDDDSREYDRWFPIVCGIHEATGGSEAGRELAIEWSQQSPKFELRFFNDRVWRHITPAQHREKAFTRATVYQEAFKHGWQKPTSAEGMPDGVGQTEIMPAFARGQNGRVKPSKTNLIKALRAPAACGFRIQFDTFRGEILLAEQGATEWRPLREEDYTQISMNLERWGFGDLSKDARREGVQFVAAENKFDSAQDWLNALRWDGVPRVETFAQSYLGAGDSPYHRAVSMYMWTALAGRVLAPGCKADMVPILVGPQGCGKTTAAEAICPNKEHFVTLDLAAGDAEIARLMRGKLVCELGELKGLSSKDAEHVKAFISKTVDEWIPKYVELPIRYARRGVFIGTSNRRDFLADVTGARRWLPLDVDKCRPDLIARDRDQVWAEGAVLFKEKGVIYGEAERLARGEHEKFADQDSWQPAIAEWLHSPDLFTDESPTFVTAAQILAGAIGLQIAQQTPQAQARVKNIMEKLGIKCENKRIGGGRSRGYAIAPLEH